MPTDSELKPPGRPPVARLAAAALLALVALLVPVAPSLAAGTPNVSLAISQPAGVLYGSPAAVTFTTASPASPATMGYNLSYRAVLPVGVSYVASSAGAAPGEPLTFANKPAAGQTTLVWKNVADLAPGTTHQLAFEVMPSTQTFGMDGTFSVTGGAYLNTNADVVPGFTSTGAADTSGAGTFTGSSEIQAGAAANTSKIVALAVSESSDSAPSGKLLRGVHQHQAIYTITVTNNAIGPTTQTVVDEYLPLGLEFIGCGGANADHTTNAPTNLGNKQEYPGSGLITHAAVSGCAIPKTVDTSSYDPIGPGPNANYTHISWAVGALAAGETRTISYAAAIPLRANTTTWTGTTPAAASLGQAANLDNNSGAEVSDDTALTNYVVARGFFNGSAPATADAALTRTAQDLALTKQAQTTTLSSGAATNWDLTVRTGEYRDASAVVVTDSLPNGLCPLQNGVQLTSGPPSTADTSECLSSGPSPTAAYASATEHADGTWQLTWDSSTDAALAQMAPNSTTTITFPTRTRASYQAGFEDARPITAGDAVRNDASVAASGRLVCAPGGTACAPGPAPGTQIGNGLTFASAVQDIGSDTLTAGTPALDQKVAATSGNCATATYVEAIPRYRPGDRICWQLHVDYPAAIATNQTTLADFLPSFLTFDTSFGSGGDQTTSSDTIGGGVTLDSATATPGPGGTLRWTFPSAWVSGPSTFEHRVATTVGLPPGAAPGDVGANLLKAGDASASGASVPTRDESDYALSMPVMTASKQIVSVGGRSQTGVSTQVVHGGDVVGYRVQLINTSLDTPAQEVEAWDRLPAGVSCADVAASGTPISASGACSAGVITWGASPATGPDVPAATSASNPGTVDLTYAIQVPTTIEPTQALIGTAGIRQFHTSTNTGGAFFYYPSSNIDPTQESSANVGPASSAATLTGAEPTVAQTRTTSLNESNGAVDYNTDQTATIGETIHHTVTATVPAGVSVRDFSVTDPVDTRETVTVASLAQTSGPTGSPVALGASGNTVTLSLGSTYTAPTGADTVFTFAFDGVVADAATNYRGGAVLSNAATLLYDQPGQSAPTTNALVTLPLQTAIVEPLLTTDNSVTPGGAVNPGQTLTFTVLARNGSGAVSPAHDTTIIDSIPVGLTPLNELGNAIADGEYTQGGPATGGKWDASARTLSFPPAATINPGDADVHTFRATVDSPVTAGAGLLSTVVAKTTSLPGAASGERSFASSRSTGYSDTKALTLNAQGATVSQSPALSTLTPAQQQTFTLTVTIPANTKLYDVYVSDPLPDTMVFDAHGFDQCTSGCSAVGSTPPFNKYDIVSGALNTQIVAWDLGDIAATSTARVISLPFTAHLLAARRGSGNPGTPIVRTNSGSIPAVVSSDRTDKRSYGSSAAYPGPGYVFDDNSSPSAAAFNVVEPILTIDKKVAANNFTYVDGPLTVHDGDTLRYKITVTNSGDQPAYDITIKDTPDPRITNVQMSAGTSSTANTLVNGGHPWTGAGDYIAWSVGTSGLAPGASISVDYTATLPAVTTIHQGATFVNTVNVQDAFGLPGSYRAMHGGTAYVYRHYNYVSSATLADATTVKYDRPTVSILKTTNIAPGYAKSGPAQIDHPFTWRVTVTNTSPTAAATKLSVTDTLPKDWTFEPGSASFSSGGSVQPTVTSDPAGDQLVWSTTIGLAAGASTVLTYQARPTIASVSSIGTGATHPHINTANASVLDAAGAPADADGAFVPLAPDTASAIISLPSIHVTGTPDGGTAHSGETVPFHVVVLNNGTVEATNVVVTDTLPAGAAYAARAATASPPAGFSEAPGAATTASWTIATLAAGASVDITVPVASDPTSPANTVLTNRASVSSAQTGAAGSDDATVTLTPSADLKASKVAQDAQGTVVAAATAGKELDYVIGATNLGPSVAQTVVLKDQLPAAVDFVSAPAGCTSAPTAPATAPATATVTCTFSGATAVGSVVSAKIVTSVKAGAGASAGNTVKASSATADPVAGNDTASVAVGIGTLADLSVRQSIVGASPDPHAASAVNGQTVQFDLAVHNAGPSDATGVSTVETLPAGLTFVSATTTNFPVGAAGCAAPVGRVLTCSVGGLAAGGPAPQLTDPVVRVTARANALGPQVSAATSAETTLDPRPADDADSATVTVTPAADLTLAATSAATVPAGDTLAYTLTATNSGPDAATGTVITATLPDGTSLESGDPGCTAALQVVTCLVGPMASGASASTHILARVPVSLGATAITLNASVVGVETDPTPSNNAASASAQVGPIADIQLTQSGPDGVEAGGTYTFTLTVRNDGPSDAPDVDVSDELPDGVSPQRLTAARAAASRAALVGADRSTVRGGATGRAATSSQGSCTTASSVVSCHLGTLPAGASTLVTIAVDVPESLGNATLINTASAKSSIPDPVLSNEAASFQTHIKAKAPAPLPVAPPPVGAPPARVAPPAHVVRPVAPPRRSADLSIAKSADGVARANRELRYQITATNHGPSDAEDVVVEDALEAGVQYRAYQTGDGRCTFSGGKLHCKVGLLKAGEVTAIHVTVVPSRTGELVNDATISSSTSDPITSDNRAVAINTVSKLRPTKLQLTTTTTAHKVRGGQRVTYALSVRNIGKNAAANMQVCNRVPGVLAFTSTVGGTLNGSRLCFTQKRLAPGRRAVFKVKVRVAARARRGVIVNRAFADAENAPVQSASVKSRVITDGKVTPAAVQGFTG